MAMVIRRGTRADARAASDLWLSARKASVGEIPSPVHSDDDVRDWFASYVVEDAELWVAEAPAGTLVGILVLDGPWLDQLYVAPAMTGRGIGQALVRVAKRERPEGLRLWTFASNRRAQRFYERHGFVKTRCTDGRDNERAPRTSSTSGAGGPASAEPGDPADDTSGIRPRGLSLGAKVTPQPSGGLARRPARNARLSRAEVMVCAGSPPRPTPAMQRRPARPAAAAA